MPTSAIRHEIVPKAYYINEIPKKVIAKWHIDCIDFKVPLKNYNKKITGENSRFFVSNSLFEMLPFPKFEFT